MYNNAESIWIMGSIPIGIGASHTRGTFKNAQSTVNLERGGTDE